MTAEEKILDLEYRLEQYHACLVEAIEQRDKLSLDAAWGVHSSFYTALVTVGVVFAAHYIFGDSGWIVGTITIIAFLIIPMVTHSWSNRQRMEEVEHLAKLPEWTTS